jgi:hypothetical protein
MNFIFQFYVVVWSIDVTITVAFIYLDLDHGIAFIQ